LTLGDGLYRRIDGIDLIVARGLAAAVVVIILKDDLLGFGIKALPLGIAGWTCRVFMPLRLLV
jgi:hypothetical protein